MVVIVVWGWNALVDSCLEPVRKDISRVGCGGVAQVDFPSTLSFMTVDIRWPTASDSCFCAFSATMAVPSWTVSWNKTFLPWVAYCYVRIWSVVRKVTNTWFYSYYHFLKADDKTQRSYVIALALQLAYGWHGWWEHVWYNSPRTFSDASLLCFETGPPLRPVWIQIQRHSMHPSFGQ